MCLSRTRLRFNIALSMNLHFSLMLFAFLSYFLIASIPNPAAIAIYAGLIVFFALGLYRTWKTDVVPTADLLCDGEVALCRIDRVTWQDPILCGGSYPRRADYTLFVRDGNDYRTIPGQLRKPEQIRALNLREGDIRHAIYDPADPARNTLDVRNVRWADFERVVKAVPVVRTVLALVATVLVSCSAFAEPPKDAAGDPIPQGATSRLGTLRFRNLSTEHHIAFTPDGKTVLTASQRIHVWDVATGTLLRRIEPPNNHLYGAVLSPDGTRIATFGTDRTSQKDKAIRLWDVKTGTEIRSLVIEDDDPSGVVFSTDGTSLVNACSDGSVRIWDIETGKQTHRIVAAGLTTGVAVTPDGRTHYYAERDGAIRCWDVAAKKTKWLIAGTIPAAAQQVSSRTSVVLSPDGRWLAYGGGIGRVATVVRAENGEVVHRLAMTGGYSPGMTFSRDSKLLAAADYPNRPRLWDMTTGKMIHEFDGAGTIAVAFAPDGKTVAGVGASHAVRFWDVATGQPRPGPAGHTMTVKALAFTPDGKHLVSAGDDGTVRTWDVATARETRQFSTGTDWYQSFAFSADGKWVATNGPKVWNVASGTVLPAFDKVKPAAGPVSLTPDGDVIATGGLPSALFDRATGRELGKAAESHSNGLGSTVETVAVSPDGLHFAESYQEGMIRASGVIQVWDAKGQKLKRFGSGQVHYSSLAFSPDGQFLLSGTWTAWAKQGGVQLWDAATGKPIRLFGERRMVNCVAFSPDGQFVVAGGDDGARVWETKSGREVAYVRGHSGSVSAVAVSFDWKTLATGSNDTTVLLWPINVPR